MLKKPVIFIVTVIALFFVVQFFVMYALNNNDPESSQEMISYTEEEVTAYLIEEKGYKNSDLKTVTSNKKPKSSESGSSGYTVQVVFSDEPEAIYYYQVEKDKAYQFGTSGSNAQIHRNVQ